MYPFLADCQLKACNFMAVIISMWVIKTTKQFERDTKNNTETIEKR